MVELVRRADGRFEERQAPERLPSHSVTVLDVYGHLFFAGARALEARLPSSDASERPVVILRLRGRNVIEATLTEVLVAYAERLAAVGDRLYLVGISENAFAQMKRTGKLEAVDPVRVHLATPIIGQLTREASGAATAWLVRTGADVADAAAPDDDLNAPAPDNKPDPDPASDSEDGSRG